MPPVAAPAAPEVVPVPSQIPVVEPGMQVLFWKNEARQPVVAFVTCRNENGSVALSLVLKGRPGFQTGADLSGILHASCKNAKNPELNPRGYWDLTERDKDLIAMRNRIAVLESQVQQLLAAVTNPSK